MLFKKDIKPGDYVTFNTHTGADIGRVLTERTTNEDKKTIVIEVLEQKRSIYKPRIIELPYSSIKKITSRATLREIKKLVEVRGI